MAAEQSTCSACGSTDLEDDSAHGVVVSLWLAWLPGSQSTADLV